MQKVLEVTRLPAGTIPSPAQAAAIIDDMGVGDVFVYFIGDLSAARAVHVPGSGGRRLTPKAAQVDALANFMMRQGSAGEFSFGDGIVVLGHDKGTLVRKRLAENKFEYRFVKK